MSEKPILFSAPMVRAILSGHKTQTRRVVKPQPPDGTVQVSTWHHPDPRPMFVSWTRNGAPVADHPTAGAEISDWPALPCPYGEPGSTLWVREPFKRDIDHMDSRKLIVYRADDAVHDAGSAGAFDFPDIGWKPSIHMPRVASRITLEVVSVRVERLQDISEADALAEGCTQNHNGYFWGGPHAVSGLKQMATAHKAYRDLWESINGPGSWDANPFVWVVTFRRIDA